MQFRSPIGYYLRPFWPGATMPDRTMGDNGSADAIAAVGFFSLSQKMLTQFAMAVLFFGMISPLAIIMRLVGRDRLRLRRNPRQSSYWTMRAAPPERHAPISRRI